MAEGSRCFQKILRLPNAYKHQEIKCASRCFKASGLPSYFFFPFPPKIFTSPSPKFYSRLSFPPSPKFPSYKTFSHRSAPPLSPISSWYRPLFLPFSAISGHRSVASLLPHPKIEQRGLREEEKGAVHSTKPGVLQCRQVLLP